MFSPPHLRAALVLACLLCACGKEEPDVPKPQPIPERHGIPLVRLTAKDIALPSGTTLGSLLASHGHDAGMTHRLAQACKGVFDLRQLRSGDSATLFCDSLNGRLKHLVFRPDPMTLLRMDLDSVPQVTRIALPVDTVQRVVQGTITSSLWNDLVSKGHSPALVGRVADILAWQVDFFALQPGDAYRVYYQEFQVGGKGVAQGTIHAVRFQQGQTVSEAFHFRHGDAAGYYDGQGHPAKRAFLRAPLQFSRISSHFTGARMHPVLRIVRPHFGVDYAAPMGTPVVAVGDGTVITRGWSGGGGNTVKIRHDNGCMTGYLHLQGFAKGVAVGRRIQQGDLIGWVGSTGISTGPHLDYRFWKNGSPVDPLKVVTPPPPPLPASVMPTFQQTVAKIRQAMDSGIAITPTSHPSN
jgi:murein DD-endopeptidase MepM/ murein hydrolase activator NlpD